MATKHAQISKWQDDLLPHIVDRLAREDKTAAYGIWREEDKFRTVTYADLAHIIDSLAWWLVDKLGVPKRPSEPVAYIGTNDVRLTALGLAAVKAGYVVFLTSPRNSLEAHQSLFNSIDCQTLVTSEPTPPPALPILESLKPRHLMVPSIDELLDKPTSAYPYSKTFQEARTEPLFIIHTSGSTGIPKPIIWTHETGARQLNCTGCPPPDGATSIDSFYHGKRIISTLPAFHGAGLLQCLLAAIPFGNRVIFPVAAGIVTAQGLVDTLKKIPADVAVLVPSVVAELAQSPDLLDYCAEHLELIIYIGGDLPQAVGDKVAAKIRLKCQWGASEVGIPQQLMPPDLDHPCDWRYVQFHPCIGAVFDASVDGTYELVIRRGAAPIDMQPSFTIPGQDQLDEYRTRDLFEKHPTVPDAWCWRARADDIIVFLNGEKTNPVSMEHHIVGKNPELTGAIVVGAQRLQASLIIEPSAGIAHPSTNANQTTLIEKVWPSIEAANRAAPAHARVEKSLILVTSADKPLVRAGKGTIQRGASLKQYAEEIDRLYERMDDVSGDDDENELDLANAGAVIEFIRNAVCTVTSWTTVDLSADFFEMGMDSLQALRLTRKLRRAFNRKDLALSTVYRYPTISGLSTAVLSCQTSVDNQDHDKELMQPLLDNYTELVRQIRPPKLPSPRRTTKTVDVVLTGSTGSLGTFILASLISSPKVAHIFCLNRRADAQDVQASRFADAGIDGGVLKDTNRVTFIQAELSKPSLGLQEERYQSLCTRVGLIIHNAWPVNFNLGLSAFKPQLTGLVNLFRLSAASSTPAKVLFISSVSAVSGHVTSPGTESIPEKVFDTATAPIANGYGRSKFLAEQLCDAAARHISLPVQIARVGQVTGPVHHPGVWNRHEWFPSLVASSSHLGCLPADLGSQFSTIDWIPSDVLSDVLVDLAFVHGTAAEAEVFNLRNPHTPKWNEFLPALSDALRSYADRNLDVVKPSLWLSRLQDSASANGNHSSATANPAIKLFEFYRDSLWSDSISSPKLMSIDRAVQASPSLRKVEPVNEDWIRKWVEEWRR